MKATIKQDVVEAPAPGPEIPPAGPRLVEDEVDLNGVRVLDHIPEGYRECTAEEINILEDAQRDKLLIDERRARLRAEKIVLQNLENSLSIMIANMKMKQQIWRQMTGRPGPGGVAMTRDGKLIVKPSVVTVPAPAIKTEAVAPPAAVPDGATAPPTAPAVAAAVPSETAKPEADKKT
jgi:hypothetical protein